MSDFDWLIHWRGGRVVDPDGVVRAPIWREYSDVQYCHALLDRWAKDLNLLERLPRMGPWSSWWTSRYDMQRNLVIILPQLRLLKQLRLELGEEPRQIVLDTPPEPWWPTLFRLVFPNSQVSIRKSDGRRQYGRMPRQNTGEQRRAASASRLRHLPEAKAHRPRVLVISRDRTWSGERDIELGTAIEAMTDAGLDAVVMDNGYQEVDKKRSLDTRPTSHLFDEILIPQDERDPSRAPVTVPDLPCDGFSVEDVEIAPLVIELLRNICAVSYRQRLLYAQTLPRLMKEIGAQALVLTDENMGGQAFKLGAMEAGIPTVAVQHACIYEDHLNYAFPPGTDPDSIGLCDITCLYGERAREILVGRSIYPETSVIVTGQVQMDSRSFRPRDWGERNEAGERLRDRYLPAGYTRLLFFTSQGPDQASSVPKLLHAFAKSDPTNFLVIRPHPNEGPLSVLRNAIRQHGVKERTIVRNEESMDDWLEACDVHLSATSTALAEAVFFGRPNITVGSRCFGDWLGCVSGGVAIELEDYPSLDAALDYWLESSPEAQHDYEGKRQKYIHDHFYRVDGRAGERIASAVERAIAGVFA